jgi:hypothetical protein
VSAPDDANDLRGFHFKRLLRIELTQALLGFLTFAVGIGVGVWVSPAAGAGAAALALLIGLGIVFAIADSRAADSFFQTYAQAKGLALEGRAQLPPSTPLLRKGDERYANRTLTGTIAEGLEGSLALYTYEEESYDSKGNKQTSYYRYTLGLVEVPECAGFVPELYCQRKFGLKALEGLEDAFRGSKDRVEFESEALSDKYEIFSREGQDAAWLRQLFAPTFIIWLTEGAPEKFAFELVNGTLCCYVNGHKESAAELDTVAAATAAVASRLREESLE